MITGACALAIALALQPALRNSGSPSPVPPPTQTVETGSVPNPLTHILQNLGEDLRGLASADTARLTGVGAAGTGISSGADERLAQWEETTGRSSYGHLGSVLGDGWVQGAAAVTTYAAGVLAREPLVAHVGSDLIRGQVLNGLITTVTKAVVQRTRPDGGHHSFPSGHTSASFTSATVLAQHFSWKVGAPAYAVAGLIGWTRVRDDQHWLSDVVAGGVIGTIVGRTVTAGHSTSGWTLTPAPASGSVGLALSRVW